MAYRIGNSIHPDPTPKRKPTKRKDNLAFSVGAEEPGSSPPISGGHRF